MKRVACVLGVLAACALMANAENIAFWNFHDTFNTGGSGDAWKINPFGTVGAETEYASDFGNGVGELSVWGAADGSEGNLVGTNGGPVGTTGQFGSFTGTSLNDVSGSADTSSFSPIGGSSTVTANNGHYFLIELDNAIENAVLSYATRGTSTGFATHTLYYSTDDGATWTLRESHAANKTSTWAVHTVAFGDVFKFTSGHEKNMIKFVVDGATNVSGNNRFDNILVTGTIVPEPTSLLLAGLGAVALLRRR